MSRTSSLARLAAAYGAHEVRRRFRRAQPGEAGLLATYAEDRLLPVTIEERELLPEAEACISCGLCALVAARVAGLRPAELAPAYLRDYPRLAAAASDWESGEGIDELEAAAAACPVGVPLPGVMAMLRRLAST
jgi:succinate dehydrogenase/fumarate reductase-like Fe-S protein